MLFFSQSFESATPSLRSGNLNALKKRWEQAENHNRSKPPSVPLPSQSSIQRRPPALARPPSISENPLPSESPGPQTAQGGEPAADQAQLRPSAAPEAPKAEGQRGMDRDEVTHSERPEKLEEQVPTSPCASYEKLRVPLNNLKMKFEKGEDKVSKVKHKSQ